MTESNESFLAKAVEFLVKEQQRKRRWGIFFKLIILALVIGAFFSLCTDNKDNKLMADSPHTAVINLNGEIAAGGDVDADKVITALRKALEDKGTKGVILRINSPGGSPVQSDYIYNEILRLRLLHPKTPIYAVCVDICASGAYYIASATQDIYANPASMVGSIGVIMSGFGADKAIEKLGISRRVYTAGDNKDMLDPFAPVSDKTKAYTQEMLNEVHDQFIAAVEKGRGTRLKKSADVFSGLIFTGFQAEKIGLIDGYNNSSGVARDIIKEESMIDYTIKPSPFERFADRLGASFGHFISSQFNYHINE